MIIGKVQTVNGLDVVVETGINELRINVPASAGQRSITLGIEAATVLEAILKTAVARRGPEKNDTGFGNTVYKTYFAVIYVVEGTAP